MNNDFRAFCLELWPFLDNFTPIKTPSNIKIFHHQTLCSTLSTYGLRSNIYWFSQNIMKRILLSAYSLCLHNSVIRCDPVWDPITITLAQDNITKTTYNVISSSLLHQTLCKSEKKTITYLDMKISKVGKCMAVMQRIRGIFICVWDQP